MKPKPFVQQAGALAGLVFLFWIVRYCHSASFGLYEDDFTIIPRAVHMSLPDLFAFVLDYISHLYGHARPLSDSLIYILSNFGWRLGGLWGIYWLGFSVEVINLCLFYLLLRRLGGSSLAFFGGLGYLLFSADTTQAYLTHSLGLQPSITLLLLALHSFISGKKLLAYLLATVILFSYETPYTVFFAAPLLTCPWDRRWVKSALPHLAITAVILGAVIQLRLLVGEDRIGGLGFPEALLTPLQHILQGPPVSLGAYFYRPVQVLLRLDVGLAGFIAAFFVLFLFVFLKVQTKVQSASEAQSGPGTGIEIGNSLKNLFFDQEQRWRLVVAGLAMLILAYPLTFTVRAYAISGRDTRVHAAAVVGAGLLVGLIVEAVLRSPRKSWFGASVRAFLALIFCLLAGFGLIIQRDYLLAWQWQQEFWSQIIGLTPDLESGSVVLVEPNPYAHTTQIGSNTWNLPAILEQIYRFPPGWQSPRVFQLQPGWKENIPGNDFQLRLNAVTTIAHPDFLELVPASRVILIGYENDAFVRRGEELQLGEDIFKLKPVRLDARTHFEKGNFYDLLIVGDK